jgi:flagellar hook-basal body complex protein FliE
MIEKIGLQPAAAALKAIQPAEKKEVGAAELGKSFGDVLNNALTQLTVQEKSVEQLNGQFIRGESIDTHQLMINAEKLSLGLELTVQVRNKVIEAYQEIMRMQV